MANRQDKDKGVNVQVLLRCRPFSDEEVRSNAPQVVTCNELQREVAVSQNIAGKQIDRVFTFDKVFGPKAKQKDLYQQAVVPYVNEVLEGFNCTIFAYGQTGTGKTYTMEGECRKSKSGPQGKLPPDAGVIPRSVKQIFDTLESQNAEYSVKVTFLELYNEEITDLLAPEDLSKASLEEKIRKPLLLMEDGKGGVLVRGLEEEIVTNAAEIFTLLERGSAKRRTAETLLNKQSSRSHSLFTITIHIKEATPEGEELIKCGKLNLVDLAGSENISRSGAREGRAREAGEINKSLLTLGRVITALVDHSGHIPYRDSKLTRLLRDSLGGRTKTCIIATVSPSVHCLEETLSTLDYAHRAKNIKNKPEVNQKVMKTTLIKDLYGEIDRLKADLYATREKNGVYIQKERYYQEESERKAMADQIDQMTAKLETNGTQLKELQDRYDDELQQSADLSSMLQLTQQNLIATNKLLDTANETVKKSEYALKEKDFIIMEQRKAESALMQQACSLRSHVEKSLKDNALLFLKLDKEDQLHSANRALLNSFQADLSERIGILCRTIACSVTQQSEHLQSVEHICDLSMIFYNKSIAELKDKVAASRSLFLSHVEAIENAVRLHKSNANVSLEEILALAFSQSRSLEQILATEDTEANRIFKELQNGLTNHQREMAAFANELRERFDADKKHINEVSQYVLELLEELGKEGQKLQNHVNEAHDVQMKSIGDFQKEYEKQSKSEEEKLLANITNLLSSHFCRQKDLVDVKLVHLKNAELENKVYLDEHASTVEGVTTDAKRKWHAFSGQAENSNEDSRLSSVAKHCRMEVLLDECIGMADVASKQCKKAKDALIEMENKHLLDLESLVREATDSNERHDVEICSAGETTVNDTAKNCNNIVRHVDRIMGHERESTGGIREAVESHMRTIQDMQIDHVVQIAEIEKQYGDIIQHRFTDYEPSGNTPVRCEPEIPSKKSIESLRSMPMEVLAEEFGENHPFLHGSSTKELKSSPSLIPRLPLAHIN